MKIAIRTLIMIIPMFFVVLTELGSLVIVAIRSGIYFVFGKENYWTVSNEWFQIKNNAEMWYFVWKNGIDKQ